jgi:hypothetical protein
MMECPGRKPGDAQKPDEPTECRCAIANSRDTRTNRRARSNGGWVSPGLGISWRGIIWRILCTIRAVRPHIQHVLNLAHGLCGMCEETGKRYKDCIRMRLFALPEPIANARFGQNEPWMRWVVTEFAPKLPDEDAQCLRIACVGVAPDGAQDDGMR